MIERKCPSCKREMLYVEEPGHPKLSEYTCAKCKLSMGRPPSPPPVAHQTLPTYLLAVDPGLRELGLAVFQGRVLKDAVLVRNPERAARGPTAWRAMAEEVTEALEAMHYGNYIDELVTEYPQVYRASLQAGDQADLVEVAGIAGAVAGLLCVPRTTGYLPAKWKGQVPKTTHNERILALLSSSEKERIAKCPATLLHNVVDAVGIGLFHLNRRGKRMGTGT